MLPVWSDAYSIKCERVDKQHKKLFELASHAYLLNAKHTTKEEIKTILHGFFQYMKVHFKDEEEYMLSIGYPQLEEHKKIHKHIIDSLVKLIQDIHNANDMKEKLSVIAKNWLLEHILYEDMKIAAWQKNCSLKQKEAKPHEENFYYICGCYDKVHIINKNIHKKIQDGAKFSCKTCKQIIKFQEH